KSVEQAEADLKRVQKQIEGKILSENTQELVNARTRLEHAREDEAAARFKQELFQAAGKGDLPPIPLDSPLGGTVLAVHVTPAQHVPASAPLLVVADLSELWLRVPVPEHDLPRLARDQPATVVLDGVPYGSGSARGLVRAAAVAEVRQV